MSSFGVGFKALKKFCESNDKLAWLRAGLSARLFTRYELAAYEWAYKHMKKHHALPSLDTLQAQFPEIAQIDTPEPLTYYLEELDNRFYHKNLSEAITKSYEILKQNPKAHEPASKQLSEALKANKQQKYRARILDVGKEAPKLIFDHYHKLDAVEPVAQFGWDYMDQQSGGIMPGDLVSFVGRPSLGKTWMLLWTGLHNWQADRNTLFVSMEMMILPITQRIASVYTGCTISQLKMSGFATNTYKKFAAGLCGMADEAAKFYVVDGNLAANVEDIYRLADALDCRNIVIDGGYLVRHSNPRLDRFTRAAENVELMKRNTTELEASTFVSWQFNRSATDKKGNEDVGLEHIGYSDAIGQISSIVLGLFQDDGVETMNAREIRVLKGRNGEVGQFTIRWDFNSMKFNQLEPAVDDAEYEKNQACHWI